MRIECPLCGERGSEEFSYLGGLPPPRPAPDAAQSEWVTHVYLRQNPAGPLDEYWQHLHGCRAWLVVTRDTRTHAISATRLVRPGSATA